jgi:Mg-chelatase subunit ChlI
MNISPIVTAQQATSARAVWGPQAGETAFADRDLSAIAREQSPSRSTPTAFGPPVESVTTAATHVRTEGMRRRRGALAAPHFDAAQHRGAAAAMQARAARRAARAVRHARNVEASLGEQTTPAAVVGRGITRAQLVAARYAESVPQGRGNNRFEYSDESPTTQVASMQRRRSSAASRM